MDVVQPIKMLHVRYVRKKELRHSLYVPGYGLEKNEREREITVREHNRVVFMLRQALQEMSARDNVTNGFICLPVLLRPKSRGTIRLNTSDPFHDPVIDPKYLTHPDDLDTLVRGEVVTFVCEMKD